MNETIQMLINWWRDKQTVVHAYNGMSFNNKKERTTDTCYSMDEPQQYFAKWKKSDTKGHILYD